MESNSNHRLLPYVIVTFIYFIVGFLTTVNEQLQAPLKFTFLADAGNIKNTLATLISFFFFSGFLVNGTLGGKWLNLFGYKRTIIRGLLFIIVGLLLYLCSSWLGYQYPDLGLNFGDAIIPLGYIIFLLGSFVMGTSAAVIGVVVHPYAASYDIPGTQPVQRMNITTGINSIGTTTAPFFVTVIMFSGVSISEVEIKQLAIPLAVMILFIIIVVLTTIRLPIPDIANTRASAGEKLERSVWSFRHFALGVMAIFFYVGTEMSIGANINLYAFELIESDHPITFFGRKDLIIGGVDLGIHALLSTLYWGGFLVGRIGASFFNRLSARLQLIATTISASVFIVLAMITQSLWFLVAVGLMHSSMWSCIYSLSIKGLQKYTSKASGVFVSAIFGGAVFTLLQGGLADISGSWRWTWLLNVGCELFMLFYALYGFRIREKDVIS